MNTPAPDGAKHTPEPWAHAPAGQTMRTKYNQTTAIYHGDCQLIAGCFGDVKEGPEQAESNAARIVQCVNALAGVPDPASEIPAIREHYDKWKADSSLETWFPITAEEVTLYKKALQMLGRKGEDADKVIADQQAQIEDSEASLLRLRTGICGLIGDRKPITDGDFLRMLADTMEKDVLRIVELREQVERLEALRGELGAALKDMVRNGEISIGIDDPLQEYAEIPRASFADWIETARALTLKAEGGPTP